jgi:hypothetical protein
MFTIFLFRCTLSYSSTRYLSSPNITSPSADHTQPALSSRSDPLGPSRHGPSRDVREGRDRDRDRETDTGDDATSVTSSYSHHSQSSHVTPVAVARRNMQKQRAAAAARTAAGIGAGAAAVAPAASFNQGGPSALGAVSSALSPPMQLSPSTGRLTTRKSPGSVLAAAASGGGIGGTGMSNSRSDPHLRARRDPDTSPIAGHGSATKSPARQRGALRMDRDPDPDPADRDADDGLSRASDAVSLISAYSMPTHSAAAQAAAAADLQRHRASPTINNYYAPASLPSQMAASGGVASGALGNGAQSHRPKPPPQPKPRGERKERDQAQGMLPAQQPQPPQQPPNHPSGIPVPVARRAPKPLGEKERRLMAVYGGL